MRYIISAAVVLCTEMKSQTTPDSVTWAGTEINISGYAEMYYAYDFGNPPLNQKPNFLYNHTNHNSPAFNLMFLKASFLNQRWRANGALMGGTYSQYNLAHEPGILRHIFEANAGIRISKTHHLWMDAGVFPSHIGFESAIGDDCWTLTRSIAAENSPYYESGIKFTSVFFKDRLTVAILALTGWQRILPEALNGMPSAGWQVNYRTANDLLFNYSGFAGNIYANDEKQFRHYHNFYMIYEKGKFGIITGMDIGFQTEKDSSRKFNKTGNWFTPVIISRIKINQKTQMALRAEYFKDANAFVTGSFSAGGLSTFGVSCNADILLNSFLKIRLEGRMFKDRNMVFSKHHKPSAENSSFTTSIIVRF